MKDLYKVEMVILENGEPGYIIENDLFKVERSEIKEVTTLSKEVKIIKPERGVL